ncbi:MAG: bacillithiol system redox-active protein YtxJ [Flavobacteriaceae bacterium]
MNGQNGANVPKKQDISADRKVVKEQRLIKKDNIMFGNIFGKKNNEEKKEEVKIPWLYLTSLDQLMEIEKRSAQKTQMIFKHSSTCGISSMVLNMFGRGFDFKANGVDIYFLDLHKYREVSNEVGYKFQVMHQSPQLLIIKNGVVVAHDSHGSINQIDLQRYV